MIKSDNLNVSITNMGWTTLIDLQNKLITHVAVNITKVEVDAGILDPDGIPLVWVEGKYVTRVRRMTEEEYKKYTKEAELKVELDMRIYKHTHRVEKVNGEK